MGAAEESPCDLNSEREKQFPGMQNSQITIPWLYKSHYVTFLVVIVFVFALFAWLQPSQRQRQTNDQIYYGLMVVVVILAISGSVLLPRGPFIRPHPAIWDFAFGVGLCYFLFVVFISFLSTEKVLKLMNYVDPKSGIPFKSINYASNCKLSFKNMWFGINDRFFVAHLLGWTAKSLIIRNRKTCWIISIFWELLEYSLIFMFPNFAECWWDSIILDILGANAIGIEIGIQMARYFEMKEYQWLGIGEIESFWGKIKRAAQQFSPESWTTVRWLPLSSIRHFFWLNFTVLTIIVLDLQTFMLKAALLIPPESNLNVYRLIIWFGIGLPSIRQVYDYSMNPKGNGIGCVAFLGIMILMAECYVSCKFSLKDISYVPLKSAFLWSLYFIIYVIYCSFMLIHLKKKKKIL